MPCLNVDYNSIEKSMNEMNLTSQINELKIKSESGFDRLLYANQQLVKQLISQSNEDKNIDLIEGNSDLIANQYEGGFKLWEGLYDIIDYLREFQILDNFKNDQIVNVLELGCGSGLASVYVSKKLLKSNLYIQDFNEEVVKYFSAVNVLLNNGIDSEVISRFNYMFGDWSPIADELNYSGLKFDLILSSETLYNCDNYENFVKVIKTSLSEKGFVYIASKSHYFGVGGGTYSFMDYMENDEQLVCDICHEIEAPLIRQILKITFRK